MQNAAELFEREVLKSEIRKREINLYSNMTAKPYTDDVVGLLSGQICSPVQWEQLIRNMIADGIDTFIEIGPGRTLINMIKKTDPNVEVKTINDCLAEVL
ncbi:MAG: ACP S-malonyltransferase, partial [Acutalibacteraceae bacterium]|jgi:[acyl-carrier-protein] S-malonyltransferase